MTLLKAWLLLPALLCFLSLGWGLLVERLAGIRQRGVLLIPLGFAAILVVARAAMSADALAELGTPLVVAGAVAGLVLGRHRLPGRIDLWAAAAAAGAFCVFAAPVVLSGSATFAGYTVLGDTAVHFVLADWIGSHGTELGSLEPSSYRETLESYLDSGYPLGTHAALAAVRPLAFVDVAWAFQPFLSFIAASLALTLYGMASAVVRPGWRPGVLAFVAAQPALVYAFAMQGSVKELATLWLVPLVAALVPDVRGSPRGVLPLAVVAAAAIAAIGLAAGVWLAPMLLVAAWLVFREAGAGRALVVAALAFCVLLAVLSIPTLLQSPEYVDVAGKVVTSETELGNLFHPLKAAQVFGIWLAGDYRAVPPGSLAHALTVVLIVLAALSAVAGVVWLVGRRAVGPLLFLAVSLVALVYVTRAGSPWADAKALAIAAPAVLLVAGFGPFALESRGLLLVAAPVALLIALGVLASNAAIYQDVSLAPADRLTELGELGERAGGREPLLYTEFEEFGKYFLRDADPVGASEGFAVPGLSPQLTDGGRPEFGQEADVSKLSLADVQRFDAIVLRRSPANRWPPAGYTRVATTRFYELWTRDRRGPESVAQEPLDGDGGPADCRRLRQLASLIPPAGGSLSGAPAPATVVFATVDQELPKRWTKWKGRPGIVRSVGSGSVNGVVQLARAGTYELWLRGSFGPEISVSVDGRHAGSVDRQLSQPAGWVKLGALRLGEGDHRIAIARAGSGVAPGSGNTPLPLGQLVLRRAPVARRQVVVSAPRWHQLCRRPLLSASAAVPAS